MTRPAKHIGGDVRLDHPSMVTTLGDSARVAIADWGRPDRRLFPADASSAAARQLCADAPVLCGLLAERCILIAAPVRAVGVKRAWGIQPVALYGAAGLGLTFFWIFLAAALVSRRRAGGSSRRSGVRRHANLASGASVPMAQS